MLLITGNPRSGTRSYANMARQCGIDLRHEKLGRDGTVSCFFFVKSERYPNGRHEGETFNRENFSERYLLVRDPIKCIASMRSIVGTEHQEWARDLGLLTVSRESSKLLKVMEMWLTTNQYILDNLKPQVLLTEQVKKNFQQIATRQPRTPVILNRSSGYFKSKPLSVDMLESEDYDLAVEILMLYNHLKSLAGATPRIKKPL